MNETFALGPWAVSLARLAILTGLAGMVLVAEHWSRRRGEDSRWVWITLLVGLLGARTGYVMAHWQAFVEEPISIVAVWQGGWSLPWGTAAAMLYAVWHGRRAGYILARAAAVAFTCALLWGTTALLSRPAANDLPLPRLSLPTLEDGRQSLAEFNGTPTVINLWATWCPPCRREMPRLAQAQADHPQIDFVFVNQGESRQTVQNYLVPLQHPLAHVLLDSHSQVAAYYDARMLPTTLFLDSTGSVVAVHLGEVSRAALAEYLDRI